MPDMDGAELYERGSFGRGCELYTVPFFNMGRFNGKQSAQGDEDTCKTHIEMKSLLHMISLLYIN